MARNTPHSARLASHTPGRLRVKLGSGRGDPDILGRIKAGLEGREGIHRVSTNAAIGSLTLHYDPKVHSARGILGLLEDMDVVIENLAHAPSIAGSGAETPTVGEAIDDLNARLSRWTRLPVDLRTVLPLSFVGAGLWSMVRNGLMLESVPGWLLLWLGFDLFVKTRPGEVARHKRRAKP